MFKRLKIKKKMLSNNGSCIDKCENDYKYKNEYNQMDI